LNERCLSTSSTSNHSKLLPASDGECQALEHQR
jgi:hypothetical protein